MVHTPEYTNWHKRGLENKAGMPRNLELERAKKRRKQKHEQKQKRKSSALSQRREVVYIRDSQEKYKNYSMLVTANSITLRKIVFLN